MQIKIAKKSDKQAWDNYVLNHPKGLAYQLFAWKEAVEKAYGFKGIYLISQNNHQITGILPLIHVKLPFLPGNLVSLPYCDAGGPLADTPEIEKRLIQKALTISKHLNANTISIRATANIAGIEPKLTINNQKARMLLQLPTNSETLLTSLKAKVRSQAKKPMRDGLTVHSGGLELLDDFYPLFSENMRDLGSPVHSKKWIKSILTSYKNRSLLFLVKMPDQTPAAGGILLCHPNMVSVPWASSLRKFNKWNPNMLLYWGFLKYASNNGFPTFDFGRSTPNEGTYRFKKQWGAKPQPLHWMDFESVSTNLMNINSTQSVNSNQNVARHIVESVITKMPLSVSQAFGTVTRKYITL